MYFSPCKDSICGTESSLGSEPIFAIKPKPQVLQYCNYRIMSVFRIAESDLGSDFKSNLAPTEIHMVC